MNIYSPHVVFKTYNRNFKRLFGFLSPETVDRILAPSIIVLSVILTPFVVLSAWAIIAPFYSILCLIHRLFSGCIYIIDIIFGKFSTSLFNLIGHTPQTTVIQYSSHSTFGNGFSVFIVFIAMSIIILIIGVFVHAMINNYVEQPRTRSRKTYNKY